MAQVTKCVLSSNEKKIENDRRRQQIGNKLSRSPLHAQLSVNVAYCGVWSRSYCPIMDSTRGESIGGIESTLAHPGTKLGHTAFFSVRRKELRLLLLLSAGETRLSLSLSLFLPNLSSGGDRRSRVRLSLSLSLSTVLTGSAGFSLSLSLFLSQSLSKSSAGGIGVRRYIVCSEPGSAGFSLSLSLSPRHATADDPMSFAAAARWRPYVAWVKSALWCRHAEVTFPRSRPLGRWSRWVSRNETQLIWVLGDGNPSWMVVSLICLLHSSCKTEKVSFFCNHSFWSTNCSKASKAARGMHNYLVITLFVVLYT
jgi:hypothetical protein